MRKTTHRATTTSAIFLIAFCTHAAGAAAPNASGAAAWRCGSSYSDQPCAGGRAVEVQDTRSGTDSRAQDARTRDTRRQAEAMARERRALEAQAAGQRPAVIAPAPAPAAQGPVREAQATRPGTHRPKKHAKGANDAFTARGPSAEPAGKKKKKKS